MFQPINSPHAPAAIGPYSQATSTEDHVFVSGQLPIDTATGTMPGGAAAQARQSLKNVEAVLHAAGLGMSDVVKSTVFLTNLDDFGEVNEQYRTFFGGGFPARSCIEVSRLPQDALVEVEVIAHRPTTS